ncbi:hypothetical protein LOD99_10087 [Oopsacas minuta]|uniref:C3H1-type domain-containing protein n=1 Tax=Oopsacas minuta TaxID=111878 RepID=A0AAV7KIK4_9METZ|nr:hypothetical protein LOD99_10087 [Oopsacas minuta]
MTDMLWYHIRPRPKKSENVMCTAMLKGKTCNKGPKCLKPHNSLEKELWESDRKAAVMEQREIDRQLFQCRVCNSHFLAKYQLDNHMGSDGHLKKTQEYRLLPSVGSSTTFRVPLIKRPNLPLCVPHYKMCKYDYNNCKSNNCQYAHSPEELRTWEEALAIERGVSQSGENWESDSRIKTEAIKKRKKSERVDSLSSLDSINEKATGPDKNTFINMNNRFNLLDLNESSPQLNTNDGTAIADRQLQRSKSNREQTDRDELYPENRSKSESQIEDSENTESQMLNSQSLAKDGDYTPESYSNQFDGSGRDDQRFNDEGPGFHNEDKGYRNEEYDPRYQGYNQSYQNDDYRGDSRPKKRDQNRREQRNSRQPYKQSQNANMKTQLPNTVPGFMLHLRGVIKNTGIKKYLSNYPTHIRLYERNNKSLNMEIEEGSDPIKWIFRLSSNAPDKLHAVMLHDHKKSFKIGKLNRGINNQDSTQLISCPYYSYKTGCHVDREFDKDSYIDITLIYTPKFGTFRTYLILQLQFSTLLAKEIKVHVGEKKFAQIANEFMEEIQQTAQTLPETSPEDTIIWEDNFKIYPFPSEPTLTQPQPQNYPMTSAIENHVKKGTYENIKDVINPKVYCLRFHNLMYLEEYEHRSKLLRYSLVDYEINSRSVLHTITIDDPTIRDPFRVSQPGWKYVTFKLKYHMFEGYRSFRPPSIAYVIPNGTLVAFECIIAHFAFDKAHFKISDQAIAECEKHGGLALVRFGPDRKEYEKMHLSLDELNLDLLFPDHKFIDFSFNKELCSSLGKLNISSDQTKAVYSIADVQLRKVPTLISGPFGCGKTETLVSATKFLISAYADVRILIVTRNNSCANIYIEKLQTQCHSLSLLSSNKDKKPILFRFMPSDKEVYLDATNRSIQSFCKIESYTYQPPTPKEFMECNIIVSTSIASFELQTLRPELKKHMMFTHIFIDESAQIIEPETCIPLVLADPETKLVFAGDIHQTRPLILSKFGRKFNLDETLFERLYKASESISIQESFCKFNLLDNYRCPELVVSFLSNHFYQGKLRAHPPFIKGPDDFPALSFINVTGEESRAASSSSYFNKAEAEEVIRQIKLFMVEGIDSKQITVLSTYGAQIHLLRQYCKKEIGIFITISNLEGVQGCEYDVVIISTVRTISTLDSELSLGERVDLGLLDDVTQFNTILSRVRGWVMVVGSAETLKNIGSCSEVWKKYIQQCIELNSYFEDDNAAENYENDDVAVFEENKLSVNESIQNHSSSGPVPYTQLNPPINQMIELRPNSQDNFQTITLLNTQVNPRLQSQINQQQNVGRYPQPFPNFVLEKYTLVKSLKEKCSQELLLYHPRSEMGIIVRQQLELLANFEYTLQVQNHNNTQSMLYY